jgi:L-asparaginase/Glu-tRNA(Gln) amidotransferase subunit D
MLSAKEPSTFVFHIFILMLSFAGSLSAVAQELPKVAVLSTGGTIASKQVARKPHGGTESQREHGV